MKVRFGLALAASLTISLGACASGGGGGGAGAPEAEGYEPQQDEYTTAAQLMLSQAQSAESDSVAQQRYREALQNANEGIQSDTLNPLAYYQAGLALVMLDENYERVDSLLTTAVELYPPMEVDVDPVREQAWINLYNQAIQPMNQGDLEAAAELFERANQLYPDRPEAYLNLGSLYAQLGQPDQSVEAFREATDAADRQIANLQEMQGQEGVNPAQIEQQIEAANQSKNIAIQNLGQTLQQQERYAEAADVYESYLEENPEDIQVLSTYAAVLSLAEMPDSAQAIYENLLDRPGLNSLDYGFVGVGLYQAEQWERAAEAFQQALDLNPRHREAAFNLVQTYLAAEMWEELVPVTEMALELDPRTGNLHRVRARALAETGDQQTAGQVLDAYQELDFEIDNLQVQRGGQSATVSGVLTNNSVQQGEPIVLRFHFTDPEGNEIATEEVTIPAPAQGSNARLEATTDTADTELGGYWYEVVRP